MFGQDSWVDPLIDKSLTPIQKLKRFAESLQATVQGNRKPLLVHRDTLAAHSFFTATTSGDLTVTIGGVDTVVSFTSTQTATATAAATALNALTTALSKGGVDIECDNRAATLTFTSCAVGATFDIGQYRMKAVAKAPAAYGEFEVSGTDTADANEFVAAVKRWPGLSDLVAVDNSDGVITIRSRRQSTPDRDLRLLASSEVFSGAVLAATIRVCVSSVRKGLIGNHITLAASGTGASADAARLAGGTTTVETL